MSKCIIDESGNKKWYNDRGLLHRQDGPAAISSGTNNWFLNGLRHRVNGPAIEQEDGSNSWWVNGKLHRLDGPAYRGSLFKHDVWYIDGKDVTDEANIWVEENNLTIPFDEPTQMLFLMKFG